MERSPAKPADAAALPVVALVVSAYAYVWARRAVFFRLSLPWILAGPALALLGVAVVPSHPLMRDAPVRLGSSVDPFGGAALAVAWLRHLVLGEPWPRFGAPFGWRALRFLLWWLLLRLSYLLPLVLVALLGAALPIPTHPVVAIATGVAAMAVGMLVAVYLLPLMVGVALDDRPSLMQSLRFVHGHALRIWAGVLLAEIPFALFVGLLGLVGPGQLGFGFDALVFLLGERFALYAGIAVQASYAAGVYGRLLRASSRAH
ncbi:hypothetical protein HRbin40_01393 [bacterium HR40]|nr:hypothetical protein HRbin40_01393 [bacterium HR40]